MWLTWILPPRVLPKMSFEEGIPEDCRTLVVVPMMLLTPDSIRGEIEKLEVRYLANPMPNLHFSLLSDFTDAEEREMPEDDESAWVGGEGHRTAQRTSRRWHFHPLSQAAGVVRDRAPLDRMGAETREAGGTQPFSEWRRIAAFSCMPDRCRREFAT